MRLIFLIFTLAAVLYGQQSDSAVPILTDAQKIEILAARVQVDQAQALLNAAKQRFEASLTACGAFPVAVSNAGIPYCAEQVKPVQNKGEEKPKL